jgi:hypothetical protein
VPDQTKSLSPKTEPSPARPSFTKLTREMSGPSIKAALSGKEVTENNISVQEQFEIFSKNNKENEEFSEELLIKKWADLLETLNDRPNLKSTINQKPKLKGNNTILLKIDNLVQEELIRNNKPHLVAWLRKELRNSTIDLVTEFTREPVRRIIYTDDEKFDEMLRKNSALSLLKEKFHLDFDN